MKRRKLQLRGRTFPTRTLFLYFESTSPTTDRRLWIECGTRKWAGSASLSRERSGPRVKDPRWRSPPRWTSGHLRFLLERLASRVSGTWSSRLSNGSISTACRIRPSRCRWFWEYFRRHSYHRRPYHGHRLPSESVVPARRIHDESRSIIRDLRRGLFRPGLGGVYIWVWITRGVRTARFQKYDAPRAAAFEWEPSGAVEHRVGAVFPW